MFFFLICSSLFALDFALIAPYLPKNPIIIEAGAHIGSDTVTMSKYWPLGEIYAFEPSPDVFLKLKENTKGSSNIKISSFALGDRIGTADFHVSFPTDAQGSLLPPSASGWPAIWNFIKFPKKVKVSITTLDQWAKDNQITHIDFLWLDMQGGEYPMMKASPEILKTVKVVQSEVAKIPYYEGIILYEPFVAWMKSQGFTLLAFEDFGAFGDAIFIRNGLKSQTNN